MDVFKQATQQKLRIPTHKGMLSVEQLWDLDLEDLDELAVKLEEEHKNSGKKSFIAKRTPKDRTTKLMFDVTLEVLTTKKDQADAELERLENKQHNEKILEVIAGKEDEELKGKSKKELLAMLK